MYEYTAQIVSIHDGDTFRADIDLGFCAWLKAVDFRMYGINAPELATPQGPPAKAALIRMMPIGSTVKLQTLPRNSQPEAADKQEKFGRWLARVLMPQSGGVWLNVNDWMVTNGYAVVYLP